MTCGIYMWKNKHNGHMYIGYSKNIERRWREHSTLPFNSYRTDDISKAFYNAIRKYGISAFEKIILEECKEEQLKEREQWYINHYNTFKDKQHYNETPGGDGISPNAHLTGERHGMHRLTEKEVSFCRDCYAQGLRSRDIWNQYFQNKLTYEGFLRMWHGKTWKHVKPEVFQNNPHRASFGAKDRDILIKRFKQSGLSRHQFVQSKDCYVGWGTFCNMVNNPSFYDNK